MATITHDLAPLYRARRGKVDFVDVPELGFILIDGRGQPDDHGGSFQDAIQALFAVAYAAHFIVKKQSGEAPRVMPIEALWWVAGPDPADFENADADSWRWRALVAQPAPIDEPAVALAVEQAGRKRGTDLQEVRYERWEEGRCAQTLHVGPYDAEAPTIAALHEAIERAGCRPRGRHHEIYLGDPRRSAPERLRTLLRQPIAPGGEPHHG